MTGIFPRMVRIPGARRIAVTALVLAAWLPAIGVAAPPPGALPFELRGIPLEGGRERPVAAWDIDGVLFLAVDDVSELLGAPFHWRDDLGRMVLVLGEHRVAVVDGSDIALVDDDRLIHLPAAPFLWEGRLLVPLDVLVDEAGNPRPWAGAHLEFSRRDRRIAASEKRRANILDVTADPDPLGWKLLVTTDAPVRFDVVRSERASFIVTLRDAAWDPVRTALSPDLGWFEGIRFRDQGRNVEMSFGTGSLAVGYRVSLPAAGTGVEIFLGADERDLREGRLRRFEEPRGGLPVEIRTVAIDAGHGEPGSVESRMSWEAARRTAVAVRDEFGADAVLIREPEENPDAETRAERVNRIRPDVFLSFHLHRRPGGPAAFVARLPEDETAPPGNLREMGFRPFYSAQEPVLPVSRMLARNLIQAVAVRLQLEPLGVFDESLPELQAVKVPAVMLEIGIGDEGLSEWDLDEIARGAVEGLRLFLLAGETR